MNVEEEQTFVSPKKEQDDSNEDVFDPQENQPSIKNILELGEGKFTKSDELNENSKKTTSAGLTIKITKKKKNKGLTNNKQKVYKNKKKKLKKIKKNEIEKKEVKEDENNTEEINMNVQNYKPEKTNTENLLYDMLAKIIDQPPILPYSKNEPDIQDQPPISAYSINEPDIQENGFSKNLEFDFNSKMPIEDEFENSEEKSIDENFNNSQFDENFKRNKR